MLGDFNLIYRAQDKNNNRINLSLLNTFRSTIDNLQMAAIDLVGKKYTWCNDQQIPTMTKIDHLFVTPDWLEIFPRTDLHALASMGSDHCPLFLQGDNSFDFYRGFRFESYWINMPGFIEVVQEVWSQPVNTQDAFLRIHVKLLRAARAIKIWRRKQFSDWKLRWAIIQITMANLERAQEERILTAEERDFKAYLRAKALGMAAFQRARARQHSRLTWIRKGDSNTRFFQLHANMRRKKNYISSLELESGVAISQDDKARAVHDFYSKLVGRPETRTKALNWHELGYAPHDLEDLDAPFTEEEISSVIKGMPSEKAPGPDRFIGIFFKKCWSFIKIDLIRAVTAFYNHRTTTFNLVNEANIVLLPKKRMQQP
jgi:hypothetical protein